MGLRIGIGTKLATGDSSREAGSGFATEAGTTGAATGTATGTGAATGEVSSSLSFANGSLNSFFAAAILCRTS